MFLAHHRQNSYAEGPPQSALANRPQQLELPLVEPATEVKDESKDELVTTDVVAEAEQTVEAEKVPEVPAIKVKRAYRTNRTVQE